MRPAAQSEGHAGVCTAQPGRWLGREAMARRTLRGGGKTTVAGWFEIAHQHRPWRKRSSARSGSRQRRRCRNLQRLPYSVDRTHASCPFIHRRRYWAHAPGSGPAHSGRRNLRADRSRAQRTFRHPHHRAAQSCQQHQLPACIPVGFRPARNQLRTSGCRSAAGGPSPLVEEICS